MSSSSGSSEGSADVQVVLYTIYENPVDVPGCFVVRRWFVGPGVVRPEKELYAVEATLQEARAALPRGLFRIERATNDDAAVVESWV